MNYDTLANAETIQKVIGELEKRGMEGMVVGNRAEALEKIKSLIAAPRFDLHALSAAAREYGMKTMFEDGIEKAELGLTNIEEVLRVIRE